VSEQIRAVRRTRRMTNATPPVLPLGNCARPESAQAMSPVKLAHVTVLNVEDRIPWLHEATDLGCGQKLVADPRNSPLRCAQPPLPRTGPNERGRTNGFAPEPVEAL
jgi:hypothetical protein